MYTILKLQTFLLCYLVSFNSSKKLTKNFNLHNYHGISSRIVFVRFLEELKTPKRHFEIKWPLAQTWIWKKSLILQLLFRLRNLCFIVKCNVAAFLLLCKNAINQFVNPNYLLYNIKRVLRADKSYSWKIDKLHYFLGEDNFCKQRRLVLKSTRLAK